MFWGIFGVLKVWSRVLSSLQLWAQTGWHQWNEGRQSRRDELLLKNSRGLFSGWPLTQSSVIGKAPNRRIWITWHYFVHGLGWSFLVEQATASWRPLGLSDLYFSPSRSIWSQYLFTSYCSYSMKSRSAAKKLVLRHRTHNPISGSSEQHTARFCICRFGSGQLIIIIPLPLIIYIVFGMRYFGTWAAVFGIWDGNSIMREPLYTWLLGSVHYLMKY